MRIAFVIENLTPSRGGRETSTAQIALAMARTDNEVSVLCQSADWQGSGVEIVQLGCRGSSRLAQLKNFIDDLERTVAQRSFNIIHATLPVPCANVYQLRGGTIVAQKRVSLHKRKGLSRSIARIANEFNSFRRYMSRLEKQLVSNPDVLCLAVSEMVSLELEHFYRRCEGVQVVYNAVEAPDPQDEDLELQRKKNRSEIGAKDDDIVFLSVANNFRLKGIPETIKAFSRWVKSDGKGKKAKLVIIGADDPDNCKKSASRVGVGDKVVFQPYVDNIFSWYAAADVCILLSWYDPCSRVVLEATRIGLPSITTELNGAGEILTHGGGVVVSSPEAIDAIMDAMDVLAAPKKRQNFSRSCIQVAGQLSIENHIEGLLDIYKELLQNR